MWLVFALLVPFFFSSVFILDHYCVEDIFERPWMGMITSSFVSIAVFLPLPLIAPLVDWGTPSWTIIGLAILSGMIIQVNQALYFEALSQSDSGAVAAYWNLVPALLPVASYVIFAEILEFSQYIGISILIGSSLWMCALDIKEKSKQSAFWLIAVASCLQVIAMLLLDIVYSEVNFYTGFMLFNVGLVISGFFPLAFEESRIIFRMKLPTLIKWFRLFVFIEFLNLLGYAAMQMGINLGNVSLVGAIEATTPAFVLLIAGVLYFATNKKRRLISFAHLSQKMTLMLCMVVGVVLLS